MAEAKSAKKYIEAVGRRKTAVARVRIIPDTKQIIVVNGKDYKEYFTIPSLQANVLAPFAVNSDLAKISVTAVVKGGGANAQSEAVRHGISRALEKMNKELRKDLKKLGYLTRDSREKERKKPGLRRARRAPQWSKR
ncbi:MAG TPA: 30S ribosomal protein S9 [Candidatus Pacearchaeota archaeon]|nr:30S ribosomal protein S9 [Candidatus Parcubacteria bacterium]HNZ83714.1 30S ribosomal protein S9 [Candidatus Pacearchaeota archaeon]HOU45850.1 30S ribosomal protein S9 [Candidatus Pacearchaeota archaeon]HPM08364.1 30S ribosomal protein S9 [Candidatus Pacearchaeota archaeon]HQI74361.1 30S ribosomal protein S9 [Candidatus Pacearchaeota archaeon]